MIKRFGKIVLASLLFCLGSGCELGATQYLPWLDPELQIIFRPSYIYQNYDEIKSSSDGTLNQNGRDHLVGLSGALAYNNLQGEIEVNAGKGRGSHFGFYDEKLTGRYRIFDDLIGDFATVTAGVSIGYVHRLALENIGFFYHGPLQFEGFVSVGKESICEEFWLSRWWAVLGFGVATESSPWVRADVAWERNFWDCLRAKVFANSMWGFGKHSINFDETFRGYGEINHQSIDVGVGLRSSFDFECWNSVALELEYARRVYAKNCPVGVNVVLIRLEVPITF